MTDLLLPGTCPHCNGIAQDYGRTTIVLFSGEKLKCHLLICDTDPNHILFAPCLDDETVEILEEVNRILRMGDTL